MHDDARSHTAAIADVEALQRLLGPSARFCRRALDGTEGVALAPLCDHHVHIQLVAEHALAAHGIAAVVDLGGDPAALARRPGGGLPTVTYAGAFLTVPGGYPSFRPWAPAQVVRIISSPSAAPGVRGGARTAVDEMADAGAGLVKIALDVTAGPVFDLPTLRAVVNAAHARGIPAVAHAAGAGSVQLALDGGVDVLAHAPFTEELDDETVARAASTQRWISTLASHDGSAAAARNVAAFVAAGGRVLYGTDMGGSDAPAGIDERELQALHDAGLEGPRLLGTLADPWPHPHAETAVATFVPGPAPAGVDDVPHWLSGARVVPAEEVLAYDE